MVLLLNHLVRRHNECLRLHQDLVKLLLLHFLLNPQSLDLPLLLITLLAVLVPLLVVFEPLVEVFSDDSFVATILLEASRNRSQGALGLFLHL